MSIVCDKHLTDEVIAKAFENTNFGREDHRTILAETVIKRAAGYHSGWTATTICIRLGLLTEKNQSATKLGMTMAFHHYYRQSVRDAINADRLRHGTHDTADKAKDDEHASLTALPVERDKYGYWSHPDYLAFCDGREYIPTDEFDQWMEAKGLEWKVDYRDEEETDYDADGYDLSTWSPKAPAGDGWFVGSIHDTDDGAVCIWLRAKAVE